MKESTVKSIYWETLSANPMQLFIGIVVLGIAVGVIGVISRSITRSKRKAS